jgi:lysophospholipase L1-like esterase
MASEFTARPAFLRELKVPLALLLALLGLVFIQARFERRAWFPADANRWISVMRWREDWDAAGFKAANYYEGLISSGADRLPPVLRANGWKFFQVGWPALDRILRRTHPDYLIYSMRPGAATSSPAGEIRVNSHGMVDREYSPAKPPRTWRIAFLGDSLARGLGVSTDARFESLLEDFLNRNASSANFDRYEILNFSVSGYQLSQMLAVADDSARRFSPDVYLVGLTHQHVTEQWCDHLWTLHRAGRDLRYPLFRELALEARLSARELREDAQRRMRPYLARGVTGMLRILEERAARDGAALVVLLLPSVVDYRSVEHDFQSARQMLSETGVPLLDLSETFRGVSNFRALRVSEFDPHPNPAGQRMLFEMMLRRLREDPELRSAVLGSRDALAAPAPELVGQNPPSTRRP